MTDREFPHVKPNPPRPKPPKPPKPVPPSPPQPPKPVPPQPPTEGLASPYPIAALPFTPATRFRATGSLPADRIEGILDAMRSPMTVESEAIAAALDGLSALAIAQSYKESRYALDEIAQETHNPLGLLWYVGMVPRMPIDDSRGVPLIIFPSYAAAFAEWFRRMTDPNYKAGVYMPRDMPLERMIRTYVAGPGPGYANGESAGSVKLYLDQTIARMNRYFGLTSPDPTQPGPGGNPGDPNAPTVPYRVAHIPWSNSNRPGITMNSGGPRYITVHETANPNPGAGAESHRHFVDELSGGSENVSFHLTVDDGVAIELLPFTEIGYHAGDGCDSRQTDLGCYDSIAIETCVNSDGNWSQTKRNLTALLVKLIRENPTLSVDRIREHNRWSGKNCPAIMRREGSLPGIIAEVAKWV